MRIHFIQHESFEDPGAYMSWAQSRGHEISVSKVFLYQELPDSVQDMDMLVVMGGPQSPNTSPAECPYFNARAEIELIKRCVTSGKMVIGVCLGAQLLGEAFGAKVEQSPQREIGVFPILLTHEGLQDGRLSHLGMQARVGHWHNDMPGLTADSKLLAFSKGCPRQIIAYSDFVYGFQCHLEFNPDIISDLIAHDPTLSQAAEHHRYIQKPEELCSFDYSEMNQMLFRFLDRLSADFLRFTHPA